MSTICTVLELRQYLDQVEAGAEQDALLQAILDRAEAAVQRQLIGVELAPPHGDDLKQIVLEVASSIWLTKGSSSLLKTIGVEGETSVEYVGHLNARQKAALLQIRISASGVAF